MQRSIGMRAGFLVLALIGVLAYVVSAATTYADPSGRFSFTVPDGYVQRFRAGTDISYRSSSTQTSTVDITVIAQAPDPIPSADTIAMNTLKGLNPPAYMPSMSGIQPTLLGGQAARKFDYFTTLEGVTTRTHTLQVVATTTKAAYVLVFSAADTDYTQMLNDTAIILGSFTFGSASGTGSVTTGGSAIGATSTATSIPTTPAAAAPAIPLTPTQVGSYAMNNPGPTLSPDLAPPPPIMTPMPGPLPVFTISTPTPVIAPGTTTGGGTSGSNLAPPITTPIPGTAPAFTISTPTAVNVGGFGTTPVAGTGAPPTGTDAGTGNGYPRPLANP